MFRILLTIELLLYLLIICHTDLYAVNKPLCKPVCCFLAFIFFCFSHYKVGIKQDFVKVYRQPLKQSNTKHLNKKWIQSVLCTLNNTLYCFFHAVSSSLMCYVASRSKHSATEPSRSKTGTGFMNKLNSLQCKATLMSFSVLVSYSVILLARFFPSHLKGWLSFISLCLAGTGFCLSQLDYALRNLQYFKTRASLGGTIYARREP